MDNLNYSQECLDRDQVCILYYNTSIPSYSLWYGYEHAIMKQTLHTRYLWWHNFKHDKNTEISKIANKWIKSLS